MAFIVAKFYMKLDVYVHVWNFLLIEFPSNFEIVAFMLRIRYRLVFDNLLSIKSIDNRYRSLSIILTVSIKNFKFFSRPFRTNYKFWSGFNFFSTFLIIQDSVKTGSKKSKKDRSIYTIWIHIRTARNKKNSRLI
jgi:hypothetical protein